MIDSEIAVYARERGDTAIDVARRRFGDICPLGMGEPKDIAEQHPDVLKRIKPLFTSARVESGRFTLFPKHKLN